MKVEYDAPTNAAYIYLVDEIERGMVKRTRAVENEGINLDFSGIGTLIGIEVLEARGRVPALLLGRVLLSEVSRKNRELIPSAQPIRQLPAADARVESGPIQFGEDWPGTFIRGDHAAVIAEHLAQLLNPAGPLDVLDISRAVLEGLLSDLQASNPTTRTQKSPP